MGLINYSANIVIVSVCLVTVARCAWMLLTWAWLKPKAVERRLRQQGLKGNSYRLLYGDMKDMSKMNKEVTSKPCSGWSADDLSDRVVPFLKQTVESYGSDSFIWSGPVPLVNILEPEFIREVLLKMNLFRKPNVNPVFSLLLPGIINYEGEKWTFHRRLINPAFHIHKLKLMIPAFHASCLDIVTEWHNMVAENDSIELDVWSYMNTLSADAISRAAFGSSYQEGRKIFELIKELASLTLQLSSSVYIPGSRYLPTPINKRMNEVDKNIQSLLRGIIDKRKNAMNAGEAAKEDLLGTLMGSSSVELQGRGANEDIVGMDVQEVIDECKLFYFAGQETTAALLVWTMILLSKHQDWQDRARKEVMNTFGEAMPTLDHLNQLKIVTMILQEVLRIYPPFVQLNRLVHEDIKLGKFILPAGILVNLPIILLHHDHQIWGDDAKEFNPERFSEGVLEATKGNTVSYFPFGWGPRICIGQNFSLIEAKLAVAMILQNFSLELSPSYVHAPCTVITLQPQFGAQVILRRL
ncbi:Cytochrome P450 CYP72A219-like protein [Drosera capensis]